MAWKMKPCRGCGGEKPPGKGMSYCPNCTTLQQSNRATASARRKKAFRYSLSMAELDRIESIRNCEVCGSDKRLVIDHNHRTGKVRGRVCDLCNKALGQARDSIAILEGLIDYLKERD